VFVMHVMSRMISPAFPYFPSIVVMSGVLLDVGGRLGCCVGHVSNNKMLSFEEFVATRVAWGKALKGACGA